MVKEGVLYYKKKDGNEVRFALFPSTKNGRLTKHCVALCQYSYIHVHVGEVCDRQTGATENLGVLPQRSYIRTHGE